MPRVNGPRTVEEMSRPREQVRVLPALEKAEKGVVMKVCPQPSARSTWVMHGRQS
jgi:hypothetical protein